MSFVGDIQAPDRVQGKLVVLLGFFALEMETIVIGDTTYVTDAQTGEWGINRGPTFAVPNPRDFAEAGAAAVGDAVLIGEEILDGTPVYHIGGVPPPDVFGGPQGSAKVDIWIAIEDSGILQIVTEGPVLLEDLGGGLGDMGISGDATLNLTIKLSGYGDPVNIEAPLNL